MIQALRVTMLLTDAYGGFGGIAKFNRDFLRALDRCQVIDRVFAVPRLIRERIDEERLPEAINYDRAAAKSKAAFIRRLAAHVTRRGRIDLVVCGHINLLPAAAILAWLKRA